MSTRARVRGGDNGVYCQGKGKTLNLFQMRWCSRADVVYTSRYNLGRRLLKVTSLKVEKIKSKNENI
ncbi:hypothetical protein J6590_093489 [Homalodisca vitripennis]|nr:hypothetical protein J6590_093489 [Homalodisca vitripennis]